jgi:hypothetical protein
MRAEIDFRPRPRLSTPYYPKKSGRPEGKMEESFKFVTGSEGIGLSCFSG